MKLILVPETSDGDPIRDILYRVMKERNLVSLRVRGASGEEVEVILPKKKWQKRITERTAPHLLRKLHSLTPQALLDAKEALLAAVAAEKEHRGEFPLTPAA